MQPIHPVNETRARQTAALSTPSARTHKKGGDSCGRWRIGQGFTALVGVVATLQGLKPVAARSSLFPAPAPAPVPGMGPQLAPAMAPAQTTAPTAQSQEPGNPLYENCYRELSADSFLCLQGLPESQLNNLVVNAPRAPTCSDFANVVWSNENSGLTGGTYEFTDIIQFKIPETDECCLVYQSNDPRGCLSFSSSGQGECVLKDRSCVSLGYASMQSIFSGETPPALGDGAGICESVGEEGELRCITEENVFIPAVGLATEAAASGTTVQVTNACSVNTATGSLTGSCTVNPTDALG